jgi:aldehyde:ferredoxin oxidoreductase
VHGFFNKLLIVDLAARTSRDEHIPDEIYRDYLGGKGLATHLLLRENPPGVDPLSPENTLIFAVGPCTDIKIQGSARYAVFTKSPLTGFYTESYSGGAAADKISRTGYDAIILKGASDEPVFLEISDARVIFHPARDLWGKDAFQTEDDVLARVGIPDAAAAVIGPGGERQVRFATISNDRWHHAGRTGVGAVMGSKKVKAIVFHGGSRRQPALPELLASHWSAINKTCLTHAGVAAYRKYGTPLMVKLTNQAGAFPDRYWSRGSREDWEQEISGDALLAKCQVKSIACPRCGMACSKRTEVRSGKHAGLVIKGPEYETIYAFGGLCMVKHLEDIIFLNHLCGGFGIDTISAGNLVAFAMLASERGVLKEKIAFGDVDAIADTLKQIAERTGVGALLSEGIVVAADEWGMADDAVHVKGLEPAGFDPRSLKGMGLAYAVNARGACHLRATFYKPELSGDIEPDQIDGKADLFIDYEDRATLFDTLIFCRFFRDLIQWDELATVIKATTGMELDKAGLRKIASDVVDATRIFNLREGLTPADDSLPEALFNNELADSGKRIDRQDLHKMVSDYYRLRGWDERGIPASYQS